MFISFFIDLLSALYNPGTHTQMFCLPSVWQVHISSSHTALNSIRSREKQMSSIDYESAMTQETVGMISLSTRLRVHQNKQLQESLQLQQTAVKINTVLEQQRTVFIMFEWFIDAEETNGSTVASQNTLRTLENKDSAMMKTLERR